jgi:Magnesium chelatase, subunit ChlI C-terminal
MPPLYRRPITGLTVTFLRTLTFRLTVTFLRTLTFLCTLTFLLTWTDLLWGAATVDAGIMKVAATAATIESLLSTGCLPVVQIVDLSTWPPDSGLTMNSDSGVILGVAASRRAGGRRASQQRQAALLRDADAMRLSARGYHRVLRVARTLADLDDAEKVGRVHLAEALSYRALADEASRAA